jgi:hypothetical protein
MHQHGYNHFEYGNPDFLCGIPASENPQYQNGIPYMVGECVYAVLAASDANCPAMYTGCGGGLSIVQSTFTSTATCGCVAPELTARPELRDFNQDSAMDLLWHNEVDGASYVYFMNETTVLGQAMIRDISTRQVIDLPAPWDIVGSGDIDKDGNTDIVIANGSTGDLQVWFMSGTDLKGSSWVHEQSSGVRIGLGPNWYLGAIGDIDKDGMLDFVMHDRASGDIQVWFMSGTDRKSYHLVNDRSTQQPIQVPGSDWRLATTADINLDGFDDLVWQLSTGEVNVWFMTGTDRFGSNSIKDHATQTILTGPAPWRLTGAGDTNRDGFPDLIWHNSSSGETQEWFLTGTDRSAAGYVVDLSDGGLETDFNGAVLTAE